MRCLKIVDFGHHKCTILAKKAFINVKVHLWRVKMHF